jgi:hypothetical protein
LTYEELQKIYEDVFVVETDLRSVEGLKGLYIDGCIAIEKSLTDTEKSCVLAEEIGHHLTSSGNILDQRNVVSRKQESKARMIAYDIQVGLVGLIDAYESGCSSAYMIANYLGVTEHFLVEAIDYYRGRYGVCTTVDNYIVYFEPVLGVMKIISR